MEQDQLQELAEKVVKLILEDEELARRLCCGTSVLPKETCPSGHSCDAEFKCSKPFKCPKGHDIVKSDPVVSPG